MAVQYAWHQMQAAGAANASDNAVKPAAPASAADDYPLPDIEPTNMPQMIGCKGRSWLRRLLLNYLGPTILFAAMDYPGCGPFSQSIRWLGKDTHPASPRLLPLQQKWNF